jgi:hypothetical protein
VGRKFQFICDVAFLPDVEDLSDDLGLAGADSQSQGVPVPRLVREQKLARFAASQTKPGNDSAHGCTSPKTCR